MRKLFLVLGTVIALFLSCPGVSAELESVVHGVKAGNIAAVKKAASDAWRSQFGGS